MRSSHAAAAEAAVPAECPARAPAAAKTLRPRHLGVPWPLVAAALQHHRRRLCRHRTQTHVGLVWVSLRWGEQLGLRPPERWVQRLTTITFPAQATTAAAKRVRSGEQTLRLRVFGAD